MTRPFWDQVTRGEGCWEWSGAKDSYGYGIYGQLRAHRYAYAEATGLESIPSGLHVLHHCDNPPCVRPDHLFLGTHLDNIRDMVAKGRNRKGTKVPGAKLTEDQVRAIWKAVQTEPLATVARRFGISVTHTASIANGVFWKHLGLGKAPRSYEVMHPSGDNWRNRGKAA